MRSQRARTPVFHIVDLESGLAELGLAAGGNADVALALFDLDGFVERTGSAAEVSRAGVTEVTRLRKAIESHFPRSVLFPYSRDGWAAVATLPLGDAILSADRVRLDHGVGVTATTGCTVSAGVACARLRKPADASELVWAAAGALAKAKDEGRNRTTAAEVDPMAMKSTYYPRTQLARLSKLASGRGRSEASVLREALEYLLTSYES